MKSKQVANSKIDTDLPSQKKIPKKKNYLTGILNLWNGTNKIFLSFFFFFKYINNIITHVINLSIKSKNLKMS